MTCHTSKLGRNLHNAKYLDCMVVSRQHFIQFLMCILYIRKMTNLMSAIWWHLPQLYFRFNQKDDYILRLSLSVCYAML